MKNRQEKKSLSEFVYKGLRTRIIIATVIIAGILSFIVYLNNYRQVDESVRSIAVDRTERFNILFINLLNDPDNLDHQAIHSALVSFSGVRSEHRLGEFIHVDIFDRHGQSITQLSLAETDVLERINTITKAHKDKIASIQTTYSESLDIDDRYHIYLQVPLWNSNGKLAAVAEGVFRVSDEAIDAIHNKTITTIMLVIGIVLVTSFILYPVITRLTNRLAAYSEDLLSSNLETIKVLGSAIAKRDSDTDAHNYRVTIYAIHLAKEINLDPARIHSLIKGSFLHDVGKIGIRDNVLLKPGKLDNDEFAIMKTHVNHGDEIIAGVNWLNDASPVVFSHHEKFDGSGYPEGTRGEAIPIEARIFAIVDVFDALTSERPYKKPFSYDKTIDILQESAGSHFDPELVNAFLRISEDLYKNYSGREDENLKLELSELSKSYFSSGLETLRY